MDRVAGYCEAHCFGSLRAALLESGWSGGSAPTDHDVVYLQENFWVTRDVTLGDPVFDRVSARWVAFCRDVLGFRLDETSSDLTRGS